MVFPLADRTRPTFASESMLIVYSPAGRTLFPQWTSNGKSNLAAIVWAFTAVAHAQVASRTTANSLTSIACRIVLAFIVILPLLVHGPMRSCCLCRSSHRAFTQQSENEKRFGSRICEISRFGLAGW